MRVRKIAKQLKLYYKNMSFDKDSDFPIIGYKVANFGAKTHYIMRMTRKHYFGLVRKYSPDSMMGRLYIHKACSPYLYDEILDFWNIKEDEC